MSSYYLYTVVWRPNSFEEVLITHVSTLKPLTFDLSDDAEEITDLLVSCIIVETQPNGGLYDYETYTAGSVESWYNDCTENGWDLHAVFPGHMQSLV